MVVVVAADMPMSALPPIVLQKSFCVGAELSIPLI
jgi:hypothetical protein